MAYTNKSNPTMVPCARNHGQFCEQCKSSKQVIDPRERLCNQCGNSLETAIGSEGYQSDYGLRDLKVTGGYCSNHLMDCTTYTFSLCEKCLRHLFMGFTIKPDLHDEIGQDLEWEQDQVTYEEQIWRSGEGPANKYKEQICNAKKDCNKLALYSLFAVEDDGETHLGYSLCLDHSESYNRSSYKLVPYKLAIFL